MYCNPNLSIGCPNLEKLFSIITIYGDVVNFIHDSFATVESPDNIGSDASIGSGSDRGGVTSMR